jgi:hypothetical protein
MSHPADDPDDLVRKKIDLNHITNMSKFSLKRTRQNSMGRVSR